MAGLDINTKLLLHADGQNGGKEIIDDGNTGHVVTEVGTAQLSTLQSQFGSTSLLLDGNSDYLTIPDTDDFNFGSDDFTMEAFIRISALPGVFYTIFEHGTDATNTFFLFVNSLGNIGLQYKIANSNVINVSTTATVSLNTMQHIALVRDGNDFKISIDGVQETVATNALVIPNWTNNFSIGYRLSRSEYYFNGYIDEARISDVARYTTSFAVQTAQHLSDTNTLFLAHMDSHDVSGNGGSNTYHIPSFIATTQVDTSTKVFGSGSFLFDGNSDYIRIPHSTDFNLGTTSDFSIDLRFKLNTLGTQVMLLDKRNSPANKEINLIKQPDDKISFATYDSLGGGGNLICNTASNIVTDLNWHHLYVERSSSGTVLAIYLDGTQVGYVSGTAQNVNSTGDLIIGANDSPAIFFDGNQDEVRFSDVTRFSSSPNVGLTDTITVPTEAYGSPSIPTSLNATKVDHRQIDLSWIAPVDNGGSPITGYKIERELKIGGGFTTIVADTGNTNVTYSDTGLAPITQYNYRVSAITALGTSDPSTADDAETDRYVWAETWAYLPFSAHGSDFSDISPNGRDFIGHAGLPSSSVASWTLGLGQGVHGILRQDNTAFDVATIKAPTPAFNMFADTEDEWTISFYVRPKVPQTSTQNVIVGRSSGEDTSGYGSYNWVVDLDKTNNAFRFRQRPTHGSEKVISSGNNTVVDLGEYKITIVKLKNNVVAMYLDDVQVDYANDFGAFSESGIDLHIAGFSNTIPTGFYGFQDEYIFANGNIFGAQPNVGLTDVISTEDQIVPTKPLVLSITSSDETQITLGWTTPDFDGGSPITGYRIDRESPIDGGFTTLVADTGNLDTTYVDSSVVDGTQYNYRVYALSAIGTSGQSNEASATAQVAEDGIRFNKIKATHEHVDPTKDWNLDKFSGIHCKNYDKL